MSTTDRLLELSHRAQIQDALLRYCRGVDRKAFDLMRSAYHEDACDDHGPYKGDIPGLIEWVRRRHGQVEQSQHMLTNCLIELNGEVAAVETYAIIFQRLVDDSGDPLARRETVMTTRYVDRFELRDEWRIAQRVVVLETVRSELVVAAGAPEGSVVQRRDQDDVLWSIRKSVGLQDTHAIG
jgi:hypothetical protein